MSGRLLDVLIFVLPFGGFVVGWMARGDDVRDRVARAYRRGWDDAVRKLSS